MPAEDSSSTIPFGFCQCGCGQLAPISPRTDRAFGWIKGQPKRYIRFHSRYVNGKPMAERLIEAVRNHASDECLLWPFSKHESGYGRLQFKGRLVGAHRLAFYLTHGHWPVPEGCHSCDTPACFNPIHIFEGTRQDNMEDASKKLRCWAKITPEIVRAIRREYVPNEPGFDQWAIARKYDISQTTVGRILARQLWKHVA